MTNIGGVPLANLPLAGAQATTAVAFIDSNPALGRLDPGALVTGTVIGRDSRGQVLLETELGQIAVATRLNPPVGATLVLQIHSAGARLSAIILSIDQRPIAGAGRAPAPPAAGQSQASAAPEPAAAPRAATAGGGAPVAANPLLRLAHDWPALQEALALAGPGGTGGASALAALLPTAGPGLGLGLLLFMSALAAGSLEGLLGAALLRQIGVAGKDALDRRLDADFAGLAALARSPADAEWRSFFVPVLDGPRLSQIRFHMRRRERPAGQTTAGAEPGEHRFVIELELARLGPLQLDGLLKERRLSLVLRSHGVLTPALRASLTRVFDQAITAGGLTGILTFQDHLAQFPVAPLEAFRGRVDPVVI